jgi:hypothetical protein
LSAVLFSFLQSVKWGGTLNAFIPLVAPLAVMGGLTLHALMARFYERGWVQIVVLAAALMQLAMISYQPVLPAPEDRTAQEKITKWVRAAPGDVFISVFSSQAYLPLNGKKYFGDDVTTGDLVRANVWSGGELVEKARRGGFSLMILRPRIEPDDLLLAVHESYVPMGKIKMGTELTRWPYMEVYVPKAARWRPEGQ